MAEVHMYKYRGDHAEYVHQIRDIRHLNQSLSWGAKDFTAKKKHDEIRHRSGTYHASWNNELGHVSLGHQP